MPRPCCNCGIGIMVGSKLIKGTGWIRNCPVHGRKAYEIRRNLDRLTNDKEET